MVLTGTLKPRAQVQVVAEVQARLLRVLRDEGARVAKGDVLAVLDETDYRLANDRARAALAVAEANRAHAQTEKERADNLLKTGGITDRDHLSAQVALQVADAGLAQARADAAISGQQLSRTQVRAPFAGRVAKRFPDAGSMLAPGAPLFTLVDDSILEFKAPVPSRDLAKVKLGAPVELGIDALPGAPVSGRIARIEPLVDERSRSFQVVVEVPGRADLVGGLFARASVRVGQVDGALVVPARRPRPRRLRPPPGRGLRGARRKGGEGRGDPGRRGPGRRPGHERPPGRRPGRPRPADRPRLRRARRGAERPGRDAGAAATEAARAAK